MRQPWHFSRAPRGARVSSSPRLAIARGRLPFWFERRQPARRCCLPLREPGDEATDASCRAPPPGLAGWRAGREAPRTLSTDSTPMLSLPRPEAPSTDGSLPLRPLLALRTKLPGRHWSLGLAALVQLPTRVRSYRYELGLAPGRLFTGVGKATCRPSTSAVYGLLSTTTDVQTPLAFDATVEPPRGG